MERSGIEGEPLSIVMRPIPDVAKIGGPNLFVYRTREEYISLMQSLMDDPPTYAINLEKYSWKEKAAQFEAVFRNLVV